MNRVYLTGCVTYKSKLMFEVCNKLETVVVLHVENTDYGVQHFRCKVVGGLCSYVLRNIQVGDNVYVIGEVVIKRRVQVHALRIYKL